MFDFRALLWAHVNKVKTVNIFQSIFIYYMKKVLSNKAVWAWRDHDSSVYGLASSKIIP